MKKLISNNKADLKQFSKFAFIGVLNTGISIGMFYFLNNLCSIFYLAASFLAYLCGVINGYFWNKLWTFKTKHSKITSEFTKFIAVNIVGMGLNALFISILVEILYINPFWAQAIAVSGVMVINYFGSKFWVFRRKEDKS